MKYFFVVLFTLFILVISLNEGAERCIRRYQHLKFVWETTKKAAMCMFWSEEKKNFIEAKRDCEGKRARLAVLKTPDLFEIFTNRNRRVPREIFIGLDDVQAEGTFMWHDDSVFEMQKYRHFWSGGEPNNFNGDEDCVYHWNLYNIGLLNDAPCKWKAYYACEKPLLTKIY